MKQFSLQTSDKLLFVRFLRAYCISSVNDSVRALYCQEFGVSASSYRDKLNSHRTFKGQELDFISEQYNIQLGNNKFECVLTDFITEMSDGDKRTNSKAEPRASRKPATIAAVQSANAA